MHLLICIVVDIRLDPQILAVLLHFYIYVIVIKRDKQKVMIGLCYIYGEKVVHVSSSSLF